jgi:hypothetical protein
MSEPTGFRAELQRLVEAIKNWDFDTGSLEQDWSALDRACAALAQPEPVAPTESDVTELSYRHIGEGSQVGFENAIAEALARWGTPANTINQEDYDRG